MLSFVIQGWENSGYAACYGRRVIPPMQQPLQPAQGLFRSAAISQRIAPRFRIRATFQQSESPETSGT